MAGLVLGASQRHEKDRIVTPLFRIVPHLQVSRPRLDSLLHLAIVTSAANVDPYKVWPAFSHCLLLT